MCGIVGYLNTNPTVSALMEAVITELLYMDTVRGADSTGIAVVPEHIKKPVEIFKKAIPGYDFIQLKGYQKLIRQNDNSCIIGHNRAATRGSVSHQNAHPFQVDGEKGQITLVHNGTIHNKHELPQGNTFGTDSEAIANAFATIGVAETVEKIDGSFSLVWYEGKDNTLNFLRNEERPMEIILDADMPRLYFASEKLMLESVLTRNNVTLGTHFTLPMKRHIKYSLKDISKPVSDTELKFFTRSYPANPYRGVSWQGGRPGYWEGSKFVEIPEREARRTEETFDNFSDIFRKNYKGKRVVFEMLACEIQNERQKTYELEGVEEGGEGLDVHAYLSKTDAHRFKVGDKLVGTCYGWKPLTINGKKFMTLIVENVKHHIPRSNGAVTHLPSLDVYLKGPYGISYHVNEWTKKTESGCANCSGNIFPAMHDTMSWSPAGDPICPECTKELAAAKVAHLNS